MLEIIVVVAILSVAITLSAPPLVRMIERQQAQQVVRSVAGELEALRVEAYLSETSLRADMVQSRLAAVMPSDWGSEVDEHLSFARTGYCRTGGVTLYEPAGREWRIMVTEGSCEPYLAER